MSQFSHRRSPAKDEYRKFVLAGLATGHKEEFHRGAKSERRVLGDDSFVEEVIGRTDREIKRTPKLEEVIKAVCDRFEVKESELSAAGRTHKLSDVRGVIAWLVLESGKLTLTELSQRVNRDISTLSSAAKRILYRSQEDTKLGKELRGLKQELLKFENTQA